MKGKSLTLIGTALTLALTTNVAVAQSTKSPIAQSSSSPTEIKMSPEGMLILCQNFPFNSRCPGGQPLNPNFPGSSTVPGTQPGEDNANPDSTTVPTAPTTPENGNPQKSTPTPASPSLPESSNPRSITELSTDSLSQNSDTALPQTPATKSYSDFSRA